MKILFIAPYRDGSGYSRAAIEYIMSLHEVGVDIVTRFVKMTNTNDSEVPEIIKSFESKDLNNIDSVIQHNLPSEFVYKNGIQNIGAFAYETTGATNTSWNEHVNLMDKIITFYKDQYDFGHKKKYVIPHALDTRKFDKTYPTIDFNLPKNTTKFYTISEFNRRKNLTALVIAYLIEFNKDDNVALIIKTSGIPSDQLKSLINELKYGIGKYDPNSNRFAPIIIITDYLTNDQINGLHQSCDIFVSASHGEAFCLPFIDSIGFDKPTIVPNHTAFKDYSLDKDLLVNCYQSTVVGVQNAPQGLYTSDEKWYNVDISSLQKTMRDFHNNKNKYHWSKTRREYVEESFSRKVIGNKLVEMIKD